MDDTTPRCVRRGGAPRSESKSIDCRGQSLIHLSAICRPPRCNYNLCGQNGTTFRHVIPTEMKWSGGIFPSCWFYLAVVLILTWWIPPLRLRCGRNDKPEGCFCLPTQVVFATSPGTAHRPFPMVSLVGGFFHPHRLYSERGGRQIAAPTDISVGGTVQPHGLYSGR